MIDAETTTLKLILTAAMREFLTKGFRAEEHCQDSGGYDRRFLWLFRQQGRFI